MTQKEKAEAFKSLHVKGSPVILFNIWDAGSARTIEQAGAKAIATGSWSVAAAHGFDDGEKIPLALVLTNIKRIVDSVAVPVTLDFETGYATELSGLKENIREVIAAGAIGINFEDRIIGADDLQKIEDQSARIRMVREAAEEASIPFFINARTDVFLKTYPAKHNESELEEALRRAAAYAEAGASGLFAPGLRIMMVACSDSRVDPAILTNTEQGEMFVVRNVANLVPPCDLDDAKHGTSAALEFAVTSLEVEHIIVLGHRGCGGIKALLTADPDLGVQHTFIHNWMNIADEARRRTLIIARNQPLEVQLKILEQEAIKTSLANLLSFPWIRERVDSNSLRLYGWHYDLYDGNMYVYVPDQDRFEPLTLELASRLQES